MFDHRQKMTVQQVKYVPEVGVRFSSDGDEEFGKSVRQFYLCMLICKLKKISGFLINNFNLPLLKLHSNPNFTRTRIQSHLELP